MKEQAKSKKRILIVDDHPMTRAGIAQWVQSDPALEVCGEAASADAGLDAAIVLRPDLVLLDISLPGKSGLELVKDIHAVDPSLPVLVFSMHEESSYAVRALRAGARGYIMKHEGGAKVIEAIWTVLAGNVHVSPAVSSLILENLTSQKKGERSGVEGLSDREFEVFQLIGKGLSTNEIGRRLHLSSKTVDSHRANIKTKLKTQTISELISLAARWSADEGNRPG